MTGIIVVAIITTISGLRNFNYNRKHSTTGIAPYVIMRNVNDQELIQKVIAKTEKTRNKIKRTIDNYEKG